MEARLDPDRWPDADRLIDEALALDPAARLPFVRDALRDDVDLRAAIEAVLLEAERNDPFLAPGGAMNGLLAAELGALDDQPAQRLPAGPGARLAGYEVLELAGLGGMGEVYRARDVHLERIVALKILPDRFAGDAERLARFEREARVLASLDHPGIARIHGVADDDGVRALVLEWVEGPTLADRLAEGPLPLAEALNVAIEIAHALEAAHHRAIVHRDLKPGNVKLAASGVKVLDFGLAKVAAPEENAPPDLLSAIHQRPGVVLGTPAYMSPEQARGHGVDHRADIWGFGCVLGELLTGRRMFPGASNSDVLSRVVDGAPEIEPLPANVPPAIRTLLERCLEKDVRRRLGWIGEAVVVLEDAIRPAVGAQVPRGAIRRLWPRAWPAAGGLALGVLAATLATPLLERRASPQVNRLAIVIPPGDELAAGDLPTIAVSRDGRRVVYRARRDGTMRLFHRALDRAEPEPIAHTENATAPFFSPDGRSVGFSRDGLLMIVRLAGGSPVVLCPTAGPVSAAWISPETIVFGGELTRGLQRVAASGGPPSALTTLDAARKERAHGLPEPIGERGYVSFTIWAGDRTEIALAALDGRERRVLGDGRQAKFVAPDRLVFVRQNALWTGRLDLKRLAFASSPKPAEERIDTSAFSGNAHFGVAPGGTLVYLARRTAQSRESPVVWADREGRERAIPIDPAPYTRAAISPDGRQVALAASGPDTPDLWVYSASRGSVARVTSDEPVDTAPVWTPDGRQLVFRSDRDGGGLFVVDASGARPPRRLTTARQSIHTPYDITPDGRNVVFTEFRTYRDQGIAMVSLDGSGTPTPLIDGPFAELRPGLSPDGRWIAYQSDESGRFEVYVRPFPAVDDGRWRVSASGGVSPVWGPDGRELFYFNDGSVVRVPVTIRGSFHAGSPAPVFSVDLPSDRLGPIFDISPDGRRFLFVKATQAESGDARSFILHVVENWTDDLNRRFPE